MDKLAGCAPLPWDEGAEGRDEKLEKLRTLHDTVLACCDRDPAKRPTARSLAKGCDHFWDDDESDEPQEAAALAPESAGGPAVRASTGGVNDEDG
jgi:hypothetical protein